ncbi:hypothetical protein DMC47_02020 [Nostoc sp. 3335mG]|nr:hypothetical protein DMC47_02020 [Nostoc sp. 3335mG]
MGIGRGKAKMPRAAEAHFSYPVAVVEPMESMRFDCCPLSIVERFGKEAIDLLARMFDLNGDGMGAPHATLLSPSPH